MDKKSIVDKYSYMPLEKATRTPTDGFCWELYAERFWIVHPEKGIAFYDPAGKGRRISPQCNSAEAVAARLRPEGHEVQYIARVWVRHNCSDYAT